MPKPGHVSLWHPWNDRHGNTHTLALWTKDQEIYVPETKQSYKPNGIEDLIYFVARNRLYVVCDDILDSQDIPDCEALLRHKRTEAFISRTGSVVALKMRNKYSGFFIPARVWAGLSSDISVLSDMAGIYGATGYQALTPASVSEKILRSTLPEKVCISRPSDMLRRFLLDYSLGGRIDEKEVAEFYPIVRQRDMNKAYLSMAQNVPNPFETPMRLYYGERGKQDDRWLSDFACSFVLVSMRVHGKGGIHPIQIREGGIMRRPHDGEHFTRGMWNFEIEDCLAKGYTLERVEHGYGWHTLSSFMVEWSRILLDLLAKYKDEHFAPLFKTMMVALPGRFLKQPENYILLHEKDAEMREGDIGILYSRMSRERGVQSPFFIRPEFNMESAQLTPIGHYIIARCRQELYHDQIRIAQHGGRVLSSYIDCNTYVGDVPAFEVGTQPGQWKQKEYEDSWVVGNQIIPADIEQMRAPSVSGKQARYEHWQKFHIGDKRE